MTKAKWGENAEQIRKLCARKIGCSLREASDAIQRPLNVTSVYITKYEKSGEVIKAGVHGEYRYFKDKKSAESHNVIAQENRLKQIAESKKRKRDTQARKERERRAKARADKGLAPWVKAEKKPKKEKISLKPRNSGIVISNKEKDLEQKKEHIKATIIWPENVKVMKRETPKDYRFFHAPDGWKGEFSREWEERRAA